MRLSRLACRTTCLILACAGAQAAAADTGQREAAVEKLRAKFAAADTNHDGFLNRDEAVRGMPHVAAHFDAVDADHDSRLSMAEVASYLVKARAAHSK